MSGILNAASQGTYVDPADPTGHIWTYFQDNDDPAVYYVVPVPAFSVQSGAPQFHLTEYCSPAGAFLSARCQLTTILVVPPAISTAVGALLRQRGIPNPRYQALPFIDVATGDADPNQATLTYADAAGTVSGSVQTLPSLSNSQTAVFVLNNLSANAVALFKDYFGGDPAAAGAVQVGYRLTAWARLGAVTARVQFDTQAAYQYQRTFEWVR